MMSFPRRQQINTCSITNEKNSRVHQKASVSICFVFPFYYRFVCVDDVAYQTNQPMSDADADDDSHVDDDDDDDDDDSHDDDDDKCDDDNDDTHLIGVIKTSQGHGPPSAAPSAVEKGEDGTTGARDDGALTNCHRHSQHGHIAGLRTAPTTQRARSKPVHEVRMERGRDF